MLTSSYNPYVLRQILPTDDTKKLSLGSSELAPLKIFLQKDASDFHKIEIAKTYVLVDPFSKFPVRIWGFITLMNSELEMNVEQRPEETSRIARYSVFPAVKIARLAIDKELQGKGYGRNILKWAICQIRSFIMPNVGCRFIVVDSKRESISFYQRNGFEVLNTEPNNVSSYPIMFFDLYRNMQEGKRIPRGTSEKRELIPIS